MYLYQELTRRLNSNNPVNVGLIGSGKFGAMFLSQVPSAPGISVVAVADCQKMRLHIQEKLLVCPVGKEFVDV